MNKVCFGCGERHIGTDTLCEGCKVLAMQAEEKVEVKQSFGFLARIIDYIGVIIAIILM